MYTEEQIHNLLESYKKYAEKENWLYAGAHAGDFTEIIEQQLDDLAVYKEATKHGCYIKKTSTGQFYVYTDQPGFEIYSTYESAFERLKELLEE